MVAQLNIDGPAGLYRVGDEQGQSLFSSASVPHLHSPTFSGPASFRASPGALSGASAKSKNWSTPPGSPASVVSATRAKTAHARSSSAGNIGFEDTSVKTSDPAGYDDLKKPEENQGEFSVARERQLLQARDFVPSLLAINAVANRPALAPYMRLPARMLSAPADPHGAPWPPYPIAAGFVEKAAASPHTSGTHFQSVAPRLLVGGPTGTYGGYDPRALFADASYSGFHLDYMFDASDWRPQYGKGVMHASTVGGLHMLAGRGGMDAAHMPARRRGSRPGTAIYSPDPKPDLAHLVLKSPVTCSTAFKSRQPRLLGGEPTYRQYDLRQRMADFAFTGRHEHMYQPPTNHVLIRDRSSSPTPDSPPRKRSSAAELASKELVRSASDLPNKWVDRPTPIDDKYRASFTPNSTSSNDGFRYGVVVRYPSRQSASVASTTPKVASNFPKPLEPFARIRPGNELNAQVLSSYNTRQRS